MRGASRIYLPHQFRNALRPLGIALGQRRADHQLDLVKQHQRQNQHPHARPGKQHLGHRHAVDDLREHLGPADHDEKTGTYRRVPQVIDAWFDSGSMPFAQFGAPHRNAALGRATTPEEQARARAVALAYGTDSANGTEGAAGNV